MRRAACERGRESYAMTRRNPLPEQLATEPFLSRAAAPRIIPRSRLRAADLRREVRGTRLATKNLNLRQRCVLFQLRMPPAAFFSHATAALLQRIPLPWSQSRVPPVHIALPSPHRAPHAEGLVGHKLQIEPQEVVSLPDGLRVTGVVRTWLDLGSQLSLADLVAAGDFIIHRRNPLASISQLATAFDRRRNRRGLVTLHTALGMLSAFAESAPESILRVIIVLAGLPEPRVNIDVTDRRGEFVARTDLAITEFKLVIEYMGDYHRTSPSQWRDDMTRRSRLEAQGWRVMEVNADDLLDQVELIDRIRRFARLQPAVTRYDS